MVFTSVVGHVKGLEFTARYKSWKSCNPRELIDGAEVLKTVSEDKQQVVGRDSRILLATSKDVI